MKKVKTVLFAAIMLFVMIFAVSCTNNDEKKGKTVIDLLGREVVVPEKIDRVVCVGGGALRLYSYVGDMSKLCGVEDVDRDGTGVGKTLSIRPYKMVNKDLFNSLPSCGIGGPTGSADAEKILACNPDVIISLYTSDKSAMDELQNKTGKPVVVLSYGKVEAFDDNVKKSVKLLGEVTGRQDRAREVVEYISGIQTELGEKFASVKNEDKPSVYLGCQSNYGTHGIESSTASYSIFDVSGVKNILDVNGYKGYQKSVDSESLLKMNPEIIILDAGGLGILKSQFKDKEKAEVYAKIKAFQTGEVYLQMPYNAYYTNLETAYCNAYFDAWVAYREQMKDFDYVAKAREIIKFFLGADCYDEIAEKMYGGFQKLDLKKTFDYFGDK